MKVALVGNQNSGKTSLFNVLTGTNQKVGNWPGVTIERKEGKIKGTDITLVDLPGVYSLNPYTSEEEVTRKYVEEENPDLIINIVDATSIERSLYLTTQLLELDSDVVVALNMTDLLDKKGIIIDEEKLSKRLNTTVIKVSALKSFGIDRLISVISNKKYIANKHKCIFSDSVENAIKEVKTFYQVSRFKAVKILEKDEQYLNLLTQEIEKNIKKLEEEYQYDIEQIFANQRYEYIVDIKKESVVRKKSGASMTDKLDKVFLNKWAAIPIFACIMFLIYYLSVGVIGSWTIDLMGELFGALTERVVIILEGLNASNWAISLISDGVIAGVGAVLTFVPQLIMLFICIALLETSGYMSRIAFFLDKVFRKFGLNGKSLIPFIVGSGCSVPGIMTARTIEDVEEKNITIICTPFMPCAAKLPIIAMFAGAFFDSYSGLVTASLYFLAIIVIIISATIMKIFIFKSKSSAFITELPEYKLPSIKYIGRDVLEKTWGFIKRAGTVILLCSIIVWFLASFNWKLEYGVNVNESIIASLGNLFAWFFYPILGEWSWGATVSAFQGLVAKELVVSNMNIIAGLAEENEVYSLIFQSGVFSFFNGASAYAFMVFNLFSAPCFGAIGAMRKELGSTKKMFIAIGLQTGIAWVLATIAFGIGTLILSII